MCICMDINIVQLLNLHAEPAFSAIKYLSGFNYTVRLKKKKTQLRQNKTLA